MADGNAFTVKTWTGEVKPVKKLTFFPETDGEGNLFYKIEGQIGSSCFLINYSYDKEEGWNQYMELLTGLILFQENAIKEASNQ